MSRLQLGALQLDLPTDWEAELDLVVRAPAVDGYRPNIRMTVRQGAGTNAEDLSKAYRARLAEGIQGAVTLEKSKEANVLGVDDAIDLTFSVEIDSTHKARHRALIIVFDETIVTLAASHRTDESDAGIKKAIERALSSVSVRKRH